MRTHMENLWRPREGVTIADKGEGLILFRFYHPLDKDFVLEGGPWTFDRNLLALRSLTLGDDFTQVPLHEVDFWVQIYGLTAEFYSEVVGKALGNFIGRFVLYDDTNQYTDQDSYMRIRVTLDVRKSLVPGEAGEETFLGSDSGLQIRKATHLLLPVRPHGPY
ncbi:hypothetical protein LINGRAHAP2_LOCUS15413 [Linum grandiflorum]